MCVVGGEGSWVDPSANTPLENRGLGNATNARSCRTPFQRSLAGQSVCLTTQRLLERLGQLEPGAAATFK